MFHGFEDVRPVSIGESEMPDSREPMRRRTRSAGRPGLAAVVPRNSRRASSRLGGPLCICREAAFQASAEVVGQAPL